MKQAVKTAAVALALLGTVAGTTSASLAANSDPPHNGHITGRSVGAGLLSLLIWLGIGQAVNADKGPKVVTHALIGILPPFRFYSGYDALVNRKGGYWNGKI